MSLSGTHLFVATPCYGGLVHQRYMQSAIALLQTCPAHGVRVSIELLGYDSLITRSRNALVAKFLDTESATHLLFVDADISFEAVQVLRMLRFGQDVVAGMYPLKMILWDDAAVERVRAGESPDSAPLRYVGVACEGAETRYTAAHTQPLPASSPNQYALFDCMIDPDTGHYLSEDYAFCRRWRSIRGQTLARYTGRTRSHRDARVRGAPAASLAVRVSCSKR
jgi:hypothetical protein